MMQYTTKFALLALIGMVEGAPLGSAATMRATVSHKRRVTMLRETLEQTLAGDTPAAGERLVCEDTSGPRKFGKLKNPKSVEVVLDKRLGEGLHGIAFRASPSPTPENTPTHAVVLDEEGAVTTTRSLLHRRPGGKAAVEVTTTGVARAPEATTTGPPETTMTTTCPPPADEGATTTGGAGAGAAEAGDPTSTTTCAPDAPASEQAPSLVFKVEKAERTAVHRSTPWVHHTSLDHECIIMRRLEGAGIENVPKCHAVCSRGGHDAIVMDFVGDAHIADDAGWAGLAPEAQERGARGIVRTVARLINSGIVNVDQRDENVLLKAETGEAYFIDMGLAQSMGDLERECSAELEAERPLGCREAGMVQRYWEDLTHLFVSSTFEIIPKTRHTVGAAREEVAAVLEEYSLPAYAVEAVNKQLAKLEQRCKDC
mmetsp:Transcript_23135/g.56247  ORF Transcript_23135/g.56247 Transcript_23135/m.56247 type:complete len:428 (-) Transcript_23135:305-1588(-)